MDQRRDPVNREEDFADASSKATSTNQPGIVLKSERVQTFLRDAIESYQPTRPEHIELNELMSKIEPSGDAGLVLRLKDGSLVQLNWTITGATQPARSATTG